VIDVGYLILTERPGTDRECTQNFGQEASWKKLLLRLRRKWSVMARKGVKELVQGRVERWTVKLII
jgi:hypothetical protein